MKKDLYPNISSSSLPSQPMKGCTIPPRSTPPTLYEQQCTVIFRAGVIITPNQITNCLRTGKRRRCEEIKTRGQVSTGTKQKSHYGGEVAASRGTSVHLCGTSISVCKVRSLRLEHYILVIIRVIVFIH